MTAPIQTARFVCKAERVRKLTDTLPHMARQSPFHVVKVIELTQAMREISAGNLKLVESYLFLGVLYLVLTLPVAFISKRLERRFQYEA